jgi:hypothetical protein
MNQDHMQDEEKALPDFYIENGLHVFTEAYHLKRGYCCENGCRHCPWKLNFTEHHTPPDIS